jgi:hypothetical protein
MPPYLDEDLGGIPEERPVASGEYALRIISAEVKRTKKDDRDMFVATCVVDGDDNATPFNTYLVLPNDDDKANDGGRLAKMFYRGLKRFLHLFEIPYDFDEVGEWVGARATASVEMKINQDNGNEYNEIRVPRLPKED